MKRFTKNSLVILFVVGMIAASIYIYAAPIAKISGIKDFLYFYAPLIAAAFGAIALFFGFRKTKKKS